ncbi:MAG TPA: HlyD family efflux transporter periplasmic adaptor subunit [Gemmataceae bacterium]
MPRPLRRVLQVLAGVAVVGLIVYAFLPGPVPADLAAVARGPMRVTVGDDGMTRIKERYVISSPLAGRLARVVLDPGDPIEGGRTLLALIDPVPPELLDVRAVAQAEARVKAAEAARKRAEADLKRAKVALEDARRGLDRARTLRAQRTISQEEFEFYEVRERIAAQEFRSAEHAVQIAEYELEQARAALIRTRPGSTGEEGQWRYEVLAPIDGEVLRVLQESATVVAPGTPLLEVGDPRDLEVVVDMLTTDAVKIDPGDKVILEHWGGEEPLHGRVRLVEPSAFTKVSALGVEEQRVNVIIDLVEPPAARPNLADAFRVEARVIIWEEDDVLKIPSGAKFRRGEEWAVFRVVDGVARLTPVKIGRDNGLEAQVLDGLEEGDVVVVHPSDRIEDGVSVEPR